jgi:hypothetical protein
LSPAPLITIPTMAVSVEARPTISTIASYLSKVSALRAWGRFRVT